ncbi:MAG: hypothetical protein PHP23_05855 [Desulfobacterales bacterium]|nr:hypothetical protein [Desulfobacterales bacterium]MDD4072304.1 hypothetical protein [Desulfobacterales bacterium]MDD4391311.1 hypothetical protein [Desulfobacterales bacterium]
METIFLQDANRLIMPSRDIIQTLDHIRNRFPWAKRITSYARSHTISRIRDNELSAIRGAGLSRLHIGMESGSDTVLDMVRKGASQKIHIEAGLKARQTEFELSEYVMPGLAGRAHSRVHAIETAHRERMLTPLRCFLEMEPEDRCLYQAGRRLGLFADLDDMQPAAQAGKSAAQSLWILFLPRPLPATGSGRFDSGVECLDIDAFGSFGRPVQNCLFQ